MQPEPSFLPLPSRLRRNVATSPGVAAPSHMSSIRLVTILYTTLYFYINLPDPAVLPSRANGKMHPTGGQSHRGFYPVSAKCALSLISCFGMKYALYCSVYLGGYHV